MELIRETQPQTQPTLPSLTYTRMVLLPRAKTYLLLAFRPIAAVDPDSSVREVPREVKGTHGEDAEPRGGHCGTLDLYLAMS